jgi:signal transduction histidine kinase
MLIGVAIAGMHYTAMTAARFSGAEPLRATMVVHEGAVLATHGLGWAVTGTTALVLGLALSGTALDRVLRERMAHTLEVQRLYAAADAARAEAERANRAKGDFLATMSHELRTPLNAIAGHVQLLAMGIHGPVNDAQREALGRVDRAQRHLLGLINDVLNFARVESGRLEYDVREILVEDVLHDVRPMIEPQAAAKDLALDVRLPEAAGLPPVPVCADRDKLSQILLNLLSNAVKFTPPNGRIVVELAIAPADARMAELRVSDNGVGISADQLERVFEPFVQVHRTRSSESQQGTGLGLAISRDLARGMGGDLTAESEPGRGSTFVLTLRRPPGAASTAHTP